MPASDSSLRVPRFPITPCSVLLGISNEVGGVTSSGVSGRIVAEGSVWHPIVPTNQSVRSWVTRR